MSGHERSKDSPATESAVDSADGTLHLEVTGENFEEVMETIRRHEAEMKRKFEDALKTGKSATIPFSVHIRSSGKEKKSAAPATEVVKPATPDSPVTPAEAPKESYRKQITRWITGKETIRNKPSTAAQPSKPTIFGRALDNKKSGTIDSALVTGAIVTGIVLPGLLSATGLTTAAIAPTTGVFVIAATAGGALYALGKYTDKIYDTESRGLMTMITGLSGLVLVPLHLLNRGAQKTATGIVNGTSNAVKGLGQGFLPSKWKDAKGLGKITSIPGKIVSWPINFLFKKNSSEKGGHADSHGHR